MRVLALTHAHLKLDGLSPVSCERVDSIAGAWGGRLNWDVDVVHTKNTKWRGIWPDGKGMKVNIHTIEAPEALMKGAPRLFSIEMKELLQQKQFGKIPSLVTHHISKRIQANKAKKDLRHMYDLVLAEKWGKYLAALPQFNQKKYDFIFVSVGYGDEYLLQSGLTLSQAFKVPMIVDFRDLWSDHHDPTRFTTRQKEQIRQIEQKVLATTVMISAPQKHYVTLLNKWAKVPTYHLQHSAYVGKDWDDGKVVSDEFRILYAGKLYANGPGITMLLELIKKMAGVKLPKPFRCHFFVDDIETLKKMASEYGVTDNIVINGWVSPWQLWKQIRSAHVLVIIDSATEENYPILLTKTFQYAYTGQQMLCLQKYENPEMDEFLTENNAGLVTIDNDKAVEWLTRLANGTQLYKILPPLRNTGQREDIAEAYGRVIEQRRNELFG